MDYYHLVNIRHTNRVFTHYDRCKPALSACANERLTDNTQQVVHDSTRYIRPRYTDDHIPRNYYGTSVSVSSWVFACSWRANYACRVSALYSRKRLIDAFLIVYVLAEFILIMVFYIRPGHHRKLWVNSEIVHLGSPTSKQLFQPRQVQMESHFTVRYEYSHITLLSTTLRRMHRRSLR